MLTANCRGLGNVVPACGVSAAKLTSLLWLSRLLNRVILVRLTLEVWDPSTLEAEGVLLLVQKSVSGLRV